MTIEHRLKNPGKRGPFKGHPILSVGHPLDAPSPPTSECLDMFPCPWCVLNKFQTIYNFQRGASFHLIIQYDKSIYKNILNKYMYLSLNYHFL